MRITELVIENWKSIQKAKESFGGKNIINRRNGTGKSSTFQAIIFGIFGKMPPGFNLNSLRYDPSKPCKILVRFVFEGDEYSFFRQFGSQSKIVVKKNEQTVCTSSKEAFEYANRILPYSIISVLWAPSTLSSSSILKPAFLVDHLLDYIFYEPKFLLNHYKKELFAQNKLVKSLEAKLMKVDDVEKLLQLKNQEIDQVKQKLKERSSFTDSHANKAAAAKNAQEELMKEDWTKVIDKNLVMNYLTVVGKNDPNKVKDELKERLEKEKAKEDSPLLAISTASLNTIKKHSEDKCACMICASEWKEEHSKNIQKVLDNPKAKNMNLIQNIEERLKSLDLDHELVLKSDKYYRLKAQVNSCQNWKEILEKYDKESNLMWKKLDQLERERDQLIKQGDVMKEYTKEMEQAKKLSSRVQMIQLYINEASTYYSTTLTDEASKILASLNSRYDQIFLSEDEYKVSVISEDMSSLNILPAIQLSSGEKTLVGVSLILAAHKLFFPYSPLLFDESFSALDKENVVALKKLFDQVDYQVFIITHDKTWTEEELGDLQ